MMEMSYQITYSKAQLLHLKSKQSISNRLFLDLKYLGILKTRRSCGGRHLLAKPVPALLPTHHDWLIQHKLRVVNYSHLLNLQYVPSYHSLGSNSTNTSNFMFSLINVHSVCNKTLPVKDLVVDRAAVTEMWLHCCGDDVVIGELCPSGYWFLHNPRSSGHGGGVGLLYKSVLNVKSRSTNPSFKSFEYLDCSFICYKSVRIIVVYRPPPLTDDALTVDLFFNEFSILMKEVITSNAELLISLLP